MPDAAEKVRGLGDFLVESHDWLRDELADLRRQVDELAATGDGSLERRPADLGQQMRTHCLDFCGALKQHHTGEDQGAFPMLAYTYPELEPDLKKLGEEHKVVAALQEQIQQLIEGYVPGESDTTRLQAELHRLSDELEAHFEYEEKTVVELLNTMGPAPDIP